MELWNSNDCAQFFRCTVKHFTDRIKPVPSFPRPRTLPTAFGRSRPYWLPQEVREWAEKHLEAA